jgi:hypothetical protein
MPRYKIEVEFSTDRALTQDELSMMEGAVIAQVEEPVNAEGNDLDVSVFEVKSKAGEEDNKYARVAWTADDILALRPKWNEERAEEWLAQNERYIQDRSVELGWEVIETLLED